MPDHDDNDRPSDEVDGQVPENPYTAPAEDPSERPVVPKSSGGVVFELMRALGLTLAVVLLVIVVGYGLLIGCCSMNL